MKKVPVFLIYLLVTGQVSYGQATTSFGTNLPGATTDYLGWATGSVITDLTIKTEDALPVNFYTNSLVNTSPAATIQTNGNVGIANANPIYRLDVTGGDININSPGNGYRLFTTGIGYAPYFLWNNDIQTNVLVGPFAGNSNTGIDENTYVGYMAGKATISGPVVFDGSHNTFVGHVAGANNTTGRQNSFFGDSAGFSTTVSYHNTLIGVNAGVTNTGGNSNTIIGYEAGKIFNNNSWNTMTGRAVGKFATGDQNCYYGKDCAQIISGTGNCYYGSHAGDDSPSSSYNSIYGYDAGRFYEGRYNCFFGWTSGNGSNISPSTYTGDYNAFYGPETNFTGTVTDLYYTVAFGWNARPAADNMIILGANQSPTGPIHVGVGLSEDT